ncbi:zinc finger matrin-type protein 1-like [Apodemus sylvaticus]|uniref:zinc finger matrin-type protein 1-like n=1 Tax=Apodemus sylvaticus TaxID=10129 RepID=UPI002242DBA7|nr:zinc finger matrin-type protein 1-like [Apodemus sylvaticus]
MEESQTNDSFQLELEDFIRKQRARGVHPNVCFREMPEDSVHQKRGSVSHGAPLLGSPSWFEDDSTSSPSYKRLAVENQAPYSRQRPESQKHCLENQPISQDRKGRTRSQEEGGASIQEPGMPKGKRYGVRGSDGENSLSKRKVSAEPGGTQLSKHRKNHHDGRDSTKGGRRSRRKKKEPEESDLWDEAILGSRY